MVDWNTLIISAISGLVAGLITIWLGPHINHKYRLEMMKEKWKFEWKSKKFDEIVREMNLKLDFYSDMYRHLQFDKSFNKTDIIKQIDNEILYRKINTTRYFKINKEILDISINLNTAEMQIALIMKEFAKRRDKLYIMKASPLILDMELLQGKLLEQLKKEFLLKN